MCSATPSAGSWNWTFSSSCLVRLPRYGQGRIYPRPWHSLSPPTMKRHSPEGSGSVPVPLSVAQGRGTHGTTAAVTTAGSASHLEGQQRHFGADSLPLVFAGKFRAFPYVDKEVRSLRADCRALGRTYACLS